MLIIIVITIDNTVLFIITTVEPLYVKYMDKLGIGSLSLVQRLSPSRRLSLYHYCITK